MAHHALAVFFAVAGVAPALGGDVNVVQVQLNLRLIEVGNARVAHRGQDAAQVRVAGVKGRFHQRRVGNGIGHLAALGAGAPAFNAHGDELGGSFAIAHDGLGQLLRGVHQCGLELLAAGAVPVADGRVARLVRGQHDEGIVGRGVAVDADAVERAIGQFARQLGQQGRVDGGVGSQVAQHGGHVGADHARALAHAGDVHCHAIDLHALAEGLGHGVGGHDAFGCACPVRWLGIGQGCGQARNQAIHGQGFQNHTRGKRQHLLRRQPQVLGQGLAGGAGALQAIGACASVGIAGVDDQSANLRTGLQVLTAHLHGCGAKAVLREHASHAGAFIEQKHRQVFAVGFANTGFGHTNAHTAHGVQRSRIKSGKIYGHDWFFLE